MSWQKKLQCKLKSSIFLTKASHVRSLVISKYNHFAFLQTGVSTFSGQIARISAPHAVMAELVDALDSGSSRETGGCSSHLDRMLFFSDLKLVRNRPSLPSEERCESQTIEALQELQFLFFL